MDDHQLYSLSYSDSLLVFPLGKVYQGPRDLLW